MTPTNWDYIIIGGGLAGSVVASRLRHYNSSLNILLLEAGSDTRNRTDIIYPNATLVGSDLDWQFQTEPVPTINGRKVFINQGKGLGGGAAINLAGWTRGSAHDFDEWAEVVNDDRWSYKNQLPFMKMSENWHENTNPEQHGLRGPVHVASISSTGRKFPLRNALAEGWEALGVEATPSCDGNAGDNLGRSELNEARVEGKRQLPPVAYSMEGIKIMTETLVEKVLLESSSDGSGLTATGVLLANGTEIRGKNVISSAGAFQSPKLLMLSGIGANKELRPHGIDIQLELPEVGKNLGDHLSFHQFWRLKSPENGYAVGSNNPLFQQPEFGFGVPLDWVTCTTVDKEKLAKALEKDNGVAPEASHPFLRNSRSFNELLVLYQAFNPQNPVVPMDGSHLSTVIVSLLPTSRGCVGLRSADPQHAPVIQPNYLHTEVDRYTYREGLRQMAKLMLETKFGEQHVLGEVTPDNVEPITVDASDKYLDERLAAGVVTSWHPHGGCSMGKVVDPGFKVKGVKNLYVVDSSVIPVALAAHLMAPIYALAEQAAAILSGKA